MSEFSSWCQGIFDMLADGGTWGVPRSGLIFHRRGDKLVLEAMMPHDPAMPLTAEQLRKWQEIDYKQIVHEFGLAGITVERKDDA